MRNKFFITSILIVSILLCFSISSFAAPYELTDNSNSDILTGSIKFTVDDTKAIAGTTVSPAKNLRVSLILTEVKDGSIINIALDTKDVIANSKTEFTSTINKTKTAGSKYIAYLWNLDSLEPYTYIAEYPSANTDIDYLKIGNQNINDIGRDTNGNLLIHEDVLPTVYGRTKNSGANVVITPPVTIPGNLIVKVTGSDNKTISETTYMIAKWPQDFYKWLESMGIDRNVNITTYVIE